MREIPLRPRGLSAPVTGRSTRDIENSARFAVHAQLQPGHHFAKFFPTSEPAGQEDEGVGEIGHECFSLVHGFNDVQFREVWVRDFFFDQSPRHYTNRFTASVQYGIRQDAH
jgi:hypothetical protein